MLRLSGDVGVLNLQSALQRAMTTDPQQRMALQQLIDQAITQARTEVAQSFPYDDPRGARWSVRRSVYKKILGANINIYNSRKAGKPTTYERPRMARPPHARGGNRIPLRQGSRTWKIQHYGPHDRGFILRFLNSGTRQRFIGGRNYDRKRYAAKMASYNEGRAGTGNRGRIRGMGWFRSAGEQALVRAVDNLANMIDEQIAKSMS